MASTNKASASEASTGKSPLMVLVKSEVLGGVRAQGTITVAVRDAIVAATGVSVKLRARPSGPNSMRRVLSYLAPGRVDATDLAAAEQMAHDAILLGNHPTHIITPHTRRTRSILIVMARLTHFS